MKRIILCCIGILTLLVSCQKGEIIPVPEIEQQTFSIGPSAQVIEFRNIRLDIPSGALADCTNIVFGYTDFCELDYGIHFFRCMVPALSPFDLVFTKPVRLTISEDEWWLMDEYGYGIDKETDQISLYEIDTENSSAVDISDSEISFRHEKIIASSDIMHFGYYQIGISRDYYLQPGQVSIEILSTDTNISFTINTLRSRYGNWGYARSTPLYLGNDVILNLRAYEYEDGEGFEMFTQVAGTGDFKRISTNDEYLYSYFSDSAFSVRSAPFDSARIFLSRFDPDGSVEGTYEGPGWFWNNSSSTVKEVELKAAFFLPGY